MNTLNILSRNLKLAAMALALAAFVAGPALAEPKGADLLSPKAKANDGAPVATMKCGACKDTAVNTSEATFKATTHGQAKLVAAHGCAACATKIEQQGQGKSATNVAKHTCGMSEGSTCCATK